MKDLAHITLTNTDKSRLLNIFNSRQDLTTHPDNIKVIWEKLNSAKIVDSEIVASNVVTMNSRVEVKNLSLGKALSIELVYPDAADAKNAKISILSPLGSSILGYSQGDEFQWEGRNGKSRFLIEKIVYQPESAGDYHL